MQSIDVQVAQLKAFVQGVGAPRPIHFIASEINICYLAALRKSKGAVPAWIAYTKPYQQAMRSLRSIEDRYGLESAYEIVLRFLANATSWRGPDAKRIKAELNALLKSCPADKHL